MLDPAVLPAFLGAVLVITLVPGPDHAFIAASALDGGVRAGVLSAVGMALGMVVHVVAAALGLAVLLQSAPAALALVRLGGAAYLLWLGVHTVSGARTSRATGRPAGPAARSGGSVRVRVGGSVLLGRAVLTNLTNPKVILFFAAFLPQFVETDGGPVGGQLAVLGLLFLLVGLAVDVVVGYGVGRVGGALAADGRAARSLPVVAGLVFLGLAALLLVDAVVAGLPVG